MSSKDMYTHKVGNIIINTAGTDTKSNSKIVGRGKLDNPYTHIYITTHFLGMEQVFQ